MFPRPPELWLTATGNNLRLVGDLSRRVLLATIDHGVEKPERLSFPFDPVARVREQWLVYRAAVLTVLRWLYLQQDHPQTVKDAWEVMNNGTP